MKKLFFTQFLLFVSFFSLNAQQYVSFPTGNAYWIYVNKTGNSGGNWGASLVYIQYMQSGTDTVINGNSYKLILQRKYLDSTVYTGLPTPNYTNKIANVTDEAVLAIREDSNRKIYVVKFPSTTEVVLYDFNLNIGDTMHMPTWEVVSGYDSVLIGSQYHKRWKTDAGGVFDVIEGVGSISGLYNILNGQNFVQLACFNAGSSGSYSYDNASCFYIHPYGTPASVAGIKENVNVAITPNPFVNRIDVNASIPVDVNIYNALGQLTLSEKQVMNKAIDTEALPSGIYFAEILGLNGIKQSVKIVK